MSIQPSGSTSTKRWPDGAIEDWQNGASYGWIEEKSGISYSQALRWMKVAKEAN